MDQGKKKGLGTKINVFIIVIILTFSYVYFLAPSQADPLNDFSLKWTCTTNIAAFSPPVTKDINGDGIHEIFLAGLKNPSGPQGRIVCIDGQTGNLIWAKDFKIGYTDYSVPLAIGDLDNDGNYEIVQSADKRTVARNAEDGSEFWNVSVHSGWHQLIIADVDGTGYPYVYVSDHDDVAPYDAKVSKIYGRNGTVAAQADMYYSCYGGISCADLTGDGIYEILVSDRSGGKGMRCYDEDLNLLWYMNEITCSSHCLIPCDINGDGVLEVVALSQGSSGGIYVLNADGTKVPGKCSKNLGLGCHVQPAVYDIDKDGNLELITAYSSYAKVWDLGSWTLDATLTDVICSEPPDFANVMGDSDLELIACSGYGTKVYDSSYTLIASLPYSSASVVQDVDNDGLNELIFLRNNSLVCYDTLAEAPTPRVRTDTPYYSERRTDAGIYVPPIFGDNQTNSPPNNPSNPSPTNHAIGVDVANDLSWTGGDPDGDLVTYDVYFGTTSTPPKVSTNQSTTTYNPGMMNLGTKYYWKIVSWDEHVASKVGLLWDFTTNYPPNIPSSPHPLNNTTGQSINHDLTWTGGDPDGDSVLYDVYFGTTTNPPKVISNQSTTIYDTGTMNYFTSYYWRIVSYDVHSVSTLGPLWHFRTASTSGDITPPIISEMSIVTSNPLDIQAPYGWENISCKVTDDVAVNSAFLVITYPDDVISNLSMNNLRGTSRYYRNITLSQYGHYNYIVGAGDTSGNTNITNSNEISLPPNWDINMDGVSTVLDYAYISNQYGKSGSPGWIREDVDNNGQIQILDFIFISSHYGGTW